MIKRLTPQTAPTAIASTFGLGFNRNDMFQLSIAVQTRYEADKTGKKTSLIKYDPVIKRGTP